MAIGNNDYLQCSGWMINGLGLKGNELLVYGLIHGFSKSADQRFFGSIQYIAEWINASKRTVYNVLNSLLDKGLIIKDEEEYHNQKFAYYRVNLELANYYASAGECEKKSPGVKKEAGPTVKQGRANKEENIKENLFSDFADKFSFTSKTREDLISTLNDFVEARKQGKKEMTDKAVDLLLNKLRKLSGTDGDLAIEILETSIINGWRGVFAPKNYDKRSRAPERRPAPSPAAESDLLARLAALGYKWNTKQGEPDLGMIKLALADEADLRYLESIGNIIEA